MDSNDPNTQKLIKAYEFLASTGHYEMPNLDEIFNRLNDVKNDIVKPKEVEELNDTTDKMYIEFMQKLKDPKIQLLLKSIGQYQIASTVYGWKYAMDNVIRAYSVNPNATFLQQRKQWYEKFNREVNVGAKKIILTIPSENTRDLDPTVVRQIMDEAGYEPHETFQSLSKQQQDYIKTMVRYHTGKGFISVPYFDISDTTLIPGEEDVWVNEVGFENNLTGKLNAAAMADLETRQGSFDTYGYDIKDLYNNEEGNVTALNAALVKGMQIKYPDLKVAKNDGTHDAISFERNLDTLADYLLERKSKIVRPENRTQAKAIIKTFIYCFTKLKPETVARQLSDNILTREAYLELRDRINEIIMLINKATVRKESKQLVNEEIPYVQSVEQMFDMMGITAQDVENNEITENINNIKENFFKTLNNIDKHRYYNERII